MPPNNSNLLTTLGTRPLNLLGLHTMNIPVDFNLVPEPQRPLVALCLANERNEMMFNQHASNFLTFALMLWTMIEKVKPNLIAELMTEQLANPTPEREVAIGLFKQVEGMVAEERKKMAAAAAAQKGAPGT
jgi:hypothetical protein